MVAGGNAVVGPGYSDPRGQEDGCVEEGYLKGVQGGDPCGGPATAKFRCRCQA